MALPANQYSISFYCKGERVLFLEYVHTIPKALKWVKSINKQWDEANIYMRKERTFVKKIRYEEFN